MSTSSIRSFEYLESLPGTVFNRLYKQPSTALAIFRRMLPHLDTAVDLLERLQIVKRIAEPGQPRSYNLTNPFAASLRLALTGAGNHKSFGVPYNSERDERMTISQLDEFARSQWESVLGYMVGSTAIGLDNAGANLDISVKRLLQYGALVEASGRNVYITQEGFAFVLQEVNAQ
ncbi:MAG: hypothetical protein Q9183_005282, partial [Haloplaca sp. 2 TL-2023]